MSCGEPKSKLSAFRDGELSPAERDLVAAHLETCGECCAYLRDVAQIGELLRSDPACDPPADMWRLIAVSAQTAPSRRERVHHWFGRAAAVAAGFALYVIGHGALTAMPRPNGVLAVAGTAGVERMLHETALALAGNWPSDERSSLFEHTPETHLLQELNKDAGS